MSDGTVEQVPIRALCVPGMLDHDDGDRRLRALGASAKPSGASTARRHRRAPTPELDEASSCPSECRHLERWFRQHRSTAFAQLILSLRVEADHVVAGGADAKRERLPPLPEADSLGSFMGSSPCHAQPEMSRRENR